MPAVVPGNGLLGLHYNSLSRGTPLPKPWLCFITFSGYSVICSHTATRTHTQTYTLALKRLKMLDTAEYRENRLWM